MPASRLILPEELVLLALDDESGRWIPIPAFALEIALGAAIIMELMLAERVEMEAEQLQLRDATPLGDPILDVALAELVADGTPRPATAWMSRFGGTDSDLATRVAARLVERGILRSEDTRLLWAFRKRTYPAASGVEEREVRARLLHLLYSDEVPDHRDALLVGLLRSTRLIEQLVGEREHHQLRHRVDAIAEREEISRAMRRTLDELHILMTTPQFGIM